MLLEALVARAGVTLKAVATAIELQAQGRLGQAPRATSTSAARSASPRRAGRFPRASGSSFTLDTDEPEERRDSCQADRTLLRRAPDAARRAAATAAIETRERARTERLDAAHRRRRIRRALHAPPAARARPLGARLRGRRRRRRHLVLEPLSGRALRRREHGLLLLVLATSCSRSGTGPSATPPSRRSCATSTTSPTASTCAATSSFDTRVTAAALRRGGEPLDDRDRPRRRASRRGSASWRPAASPTAQLPDVPGLDDLRGPVVPHRPLAARGRRLHRPAGRRHRHRLVRRSSRSRSSPSRPRTSTVFQRTPNFSMPARNAPLDPEYERRVKAELCRAPASRRATSRDRLRRAASTSRSALDDRRSERQREYEARWDRGGLGFTSAFSDLLIDQDANETAAEFVRAKIRATVRDPAVAEMLSPRRLPDRHQAALRSTPTTTRRSTATTSPWSTVRETPIEAITPTGLRTQRRASTSSTASSSRPASTR